MPFAKLKTARKIRHRLSQDRGTAPKSSNRHEDISDEDASTLAVLVIAYPYLGAIMGFGGDAVISLIIAGLIIASILMNSSRAGWLFSTYVPTRAEPDDPLVFADAVRGGVISLAFLGFFFTVGFYYGLLLLKELPVVGLWGVALSLLLGFVILQLHVGYLLIKWTYETLEPTEAVRFNQAAAIQLLSSAILFAVVLFSIEMVRQFGLSLETYRGELTLLGHLTVGLSLGIAAVFCSFAYPLLCLSIFLCTLTSRQSQSFFTEGE